MRLEAGSPLSLGGTPAVIWIRRDEWDTLGSAAAQRVAARLQAGWQVLAAGPPLPHSRGGAAARVARLRLHVARLAADHLRLCAEIAALQAELAARMPQRQDLPRQGAVPSPTAIREWRLGVFLTLEMEWPNGSSAAGPDAADVALDMRLREAFGIGLWAAPDAPEGGRAAPDLLSEASALHYAAYVLASDNRILELRRSGWAAEIAIAKRRLGEEGIAHRP